MKEMPMPKVSVIIPCYKVEKYLRRCLDSVLAQTFADWEALCINDGSPDKCGAILDEYAKCDGRFKVIHQENQGLSMARNNGKNLAQGEYIYFLDSDDAIHPQLLEVAYGLAQKHNAELVNFEYYSENKEKFITKYADPNKVKFKITSNPLFQVKRKEKYRIHFNVWTKLYKKKLLDGIDFIPKIHFEDFPHTYAVLSRRPRTVITPAKFYYYSVNDESISNAKGNPQQILDYHTGIKSVYEIYKTPEFEKELSFLKREFIPGILKQQLGRCRRADSANQPLMFKEFAKELMDLDSKGLLSWRGHKLTRYWTYKKLIKGTYEL